MTSTKGLNPGCWTNSWWSSLSFLLGDFTSSWCVISLLRDVPSISIYLIWVMIRNRLRTRNIWKKKRDWNHPSSFCASRICISTAVRGDPCRSPQWRSCRVRSCATARCEDLPDSDWRKPLDIWRLNTNRNSIPCQNMCIYILNLYNIDTNIAI
mgnify:CR=1 FL=1